MPPHFSYKNDEMNLKSKVFKLLLMLFLTSKLIAQDYESLNKKEMRAVISLRDKSIDSLNSVIQTIKNEKAQVVRDLFSTQDKKVVLENKLSLLLKRNDSLALVLTNRTNELKQTEATQERMVADLNKTSAEARELKDSLQNRLLELKLVKEKNAAQSIKLLIQIEELKADLDNTKSKLVEVLKKKKPEKGDITDTIIIRGQTLFLEMTNEQDFLDAHEKNNNFKKNDPNVLVTNEAIACKLRNGKVTKLYNNLSGGENSLLHQFWGDLHFADYFLFKKSNWGEWGEFILLDKENGDTLNIFSEPVFSDFFQYFATSSNNCLTGQGGLQIFSIDENKKVKQISSDIFGHRWNPEEVRWNPINDLIIKVSKVCTENPLPFEYVKLRLSDLKPGN